MSETEFQKLLRSAVSPAVASRIRWSGAKAPRLENVKCLRNSFAPTVQARIFAEPDEAALREVGAEIPASALSSLQSLSSYFTSSLAQQAHAKASRVKLRKGWHVVITWAVAYKATLGILPMTVKNFEALITHLLASKCSAAQIKEVWHAIIAQHRKFRLAAPTDDPKAYAQYWRVVEPQATKSRQRLPKSPTPRYTQNT